MAHSERAMTSDQLAKYLNTNPVMVRRVLAGLRERGYVSSDKGHGGGWYISCELKDVTLLDIYNAVGDPSIFAMGNRTENAECLVEQAVNESLSTAFEEAENLLITRFSQVTLADLSADFNRRFAANPKSNPHEH
jgi:DNA-binding IscR family transcriptional regulator